MKKYLIHYTGGIISPNIEKVRAANKTMARRRFIGEHLPSLKIIKIEEEK